MSDGVTDCAREMEAKEEKAKTMKKIVSEIWFNWRVEEKSNVVKIGEEERLVSTRQDAFTRYVIGEIIRTSRGDQKCMKIEIELAPEEHAVVTWEDGSVEKQKNLNKIVEIEEE